MMDPLSRLARPKPKRVTLIASNHPPTRHRIGDDLLANLAPPTVVEALTSPTGALRACLETASAPDREFVMRSARASHLGRARRAGRLGLASRGGPRRLREPQGVADRWRRRVHGQLVCQRRGEIRKENRRDTHTDGGIGRRGYQEPCLDQPHRAPIEAEHAFDQLESPFLLINIIVLLQQNGRLDGRHHRHCSPDPSRPSPPIVPTAHLDQPSPSPAAPPISTQRHGRRRGHSQVGMGRYCPDPLQQGATSENGRGLAAAGLESTRPWGHEECSGRQGRPPRAHTRWHAGLLGGHAGYTPRCVHRPRGGCGEGLQRMGDCLREKDARERAVHLGPDAT
ncbi:hypothetical protein OCS_03665 [Ophiocordyceps sinensis CO18]|uniref:Uncharacterized protein n=1 Tax=Ophiocordyceps sinensis (strain Co18 / CGMCC 3.14243) TaxID=911162 RepID=T5ADH9_OPHSC|nr:hypothetical protein OCS_03665 [Ophiocordyceps sinensis CO18]